MAHEIFTSGALSDGFWYFHVAIRGMDLKYSLVVLFYMRALIWRNPQRIFQQVLEYNEAVYLVAKDRYDRTNSCSSLAKYNFELRVKMLNSRVDNDFTS